MLHNLALYCSLFMCYVTWSHVCLFWVSVSIMKCCSTLFSVFVFHRGVPEDRGTVLTTMAMCAMLKFQPRRGLEGVGVLTKVVEPVSCVLSLRVHQAVWGNLHTSFNCSQEPPEVIHIAAMTINEKKLPSDFRVSRMNIPEL